MNLFIDTILTFCKVCLAVCCGCNTIDIYKEEIDDYYRPVKQQQKLTYHKNQLNKMCSLILSDENCEKKFEYKHEIKDIKEIIDNINSFNLEEIIQFKTTICNYYEVKYNKFFYT
ncbi:hypothetical protein J8J04_02950 ['Fragaria x ananassa' phyllody phytoplasma]|uniref:Uncharacterized protein n=1 Tax='Fragaria x ananassa' phyllody phytoplasma TaxID=2358428 RepID=A0ABS5K3X2_9MOLU|nr:hypothetical protein ['Fragaria x ananassa' phyllody phytoplasma]MBS2126626.1 hypothetical protein ['Fragaria x ananassa' phyllody phytoplasma]